MQNYTHSKQVFYHRGLSAVPEFFLKVALRMVFISTLYSFKHIADSGEVVMAPGTDS